MARITGRKLVRDQESVDHMKRIFASINRVMPENNLKQADLPETSEVIRNPLGTRRAFGWPCRRPTAISVTWS